ncbi:MAG: metallophosphoesterase [Clostridia bacterium]
MNVLILADSHYDNGETHLHYPASEAVLGQFWQWLETASRGYDLVALCGDLTVKGSACISELEFVKKKLDAIGKPYIPIPGNHDLCATKAMEERYPGIEVYEYVPIEQTNHYRVFGEQGVRFSMEFDGMLYIGFAVRNGDPDGQLDWLKKQLEKPGRKFVFGHYPLLQSRTGGFCKDWDYFRIDETIAPLAGLLGNPDHRVLAYFCGHQHINSIVPLGNTYQIETASTVLGTTSYRIMEIDDNKIRIHTERLPYVDGYAGELTLPNRSTDLEHPTVHEYHYGNESDLSIILKLL